jgi:translation initiation factor IF-2
MILLVAEMEELKADSTAPFEGVTIESRLDAKRGPVATVLVKNGTLKVGDEVFSGRTTGKVKAMIDDRGKRIRDAGPSTPVEVLGLENVPAVGSGISSERLVAAPFHGAQERQHKVLQLQEGVRVLNLVLKSDVEGTLEAICLAIQKLETSNQKTRFIHTATGDITESDVLLAQASDALVLGFNVKTSPDIKHLAKTSRVDVRVYRVIYELLTDVEKALQGLLEEKEEKGVKGEGEIIKLFTLPKSGDIIAGTRITYGSIRVGDKINVVRDGEVVHSARAKSLHVKTEEKNKVSAGVEVGVLLKPQFKFKVGDKLVIP